MNNAFRDLAAMPIVRADRTPRGGFVLPGHMAVEGGVLYVHPDAWERVSALCELCARGVWLPEGITELEFIGAPLVEIDNR